MSLTDDHRIAYVLCNFVCIHALLIFKVGECKKKILCQIKKRFRDGKEIKRFFIQSITDLSYLSVFELGLKGSHP